MERALVKCQLQKRLEIAQEISNLLIVIAVNPVAKLAQKGNDDYEHIAKFHRKVQPLHSQQSKTSNSGVDRSHYEESSGSEVQDIESDDPTV